MQETRQYILEILRERGQSTVEEIVEYLQTRRGKEITAVTVRHHLSKLQQEGLIAEPELRHRATPGRPQHVYALSEQAQTVFPNNYKHLVAHLLTELDRCVAPQGVNVIFEGVADSMALGANIPNLPMTWEERLDAIVGYLTEQGYDAFWEKSDAAYILHTRNCPYHDVVREREALCNMDLRLITQLTGVVPRRLSKVSEGGATCAYLLPCKSS